jgi:phosphoribosyl-ATP pyrophosphohydrolase/phosphoribosyl-AMP cyclohydrolase/histidinol dehydrogenase
MSDNTLHAVFKARPFAVGGSGGSRGGATSATTVRGDTSSSEDGVDILSAFIACVRSDRPDGLFTTVVCDQHGVCLGLVYSNDVSICAAVYEKRGIYWSRSRGGLWRKGDSSGMHQELLSIDLDCDGDALRFTVIQHGSPPSFCHLMTRTCWGDVHGFQHLQSILQARLVSAPPGSYTQRLFSDEDLLMKKLVEEAQELAEATKPDDVAGEAADLMYFLMVRCVAAGVSLKDIESKLDYRSLKVTRRQGNAKAYRTEAAAALVPNSAKLQAAAMQEDVQPPPAP